MSDTLKDMQAEAEKRRLEVVFAELELAITLQRLSLTEHGLGHDDGSNHTHDNAVESLHRARTLHAQMPSPDGDMWQSIAVKLRELEQLLHRRPAQH